MLVKDLRRENTWWPGPSCIKELKIKWEFLQPFPVYRRFFLHAIMDKSIKGALKSIRNTMTMRKKSSGKQGTVAEIPT